MTSAENITTFTTSNSFDNHELLIVKDIVRPNGMVNRKLVAVCGRSAVQPRNVQRNTRNEVTCPKCQTATR